jgi:transposase-like protein
MGQTKSLKPIQSRAIQLLAKGQTQKNVANTLGICPMTIGRWNKQSEFQNQLQIVTATETGMEATARKLNIAALTAVECCQEVMSCILEPAETKLRAAQLILRAVAPVNSAIEKGLKHRHFDFVLAERFADGNVYDGACELISRGDNSTLAHVNANGGVVI